MMLRPRALSHDNSVLVGVFRYLGAPSHDRTMRVAKVPGDLADTMTRPNHLDRFGTDFRQVGILGVAHGHSLIPLVGGSKLLNYYGSLTTNANKSNLLHYLVVTVTL